MPYHCVSKATRALNDLGRPVNGSKIAVFGVSCKPGVGDVRESPALKIIDLLAELGAQLAYNDPHVPALADMGLQSVSVEEALHGADLAVVVTAHPGVDHTLIAQRAPAVVDLRGVLRGAAVGSVVGL